MATASQGDGKQNNERPAFMRADNENLGTIALKSRQQSNNFFQPQMCPRFTFSVLSRNLIAE
jgi:hypothetical protein